FGALIISALVLFIIYAFFGLRLMFIWPLVALNEAAVLESFRKSWRLTSGRFWLLLGRVAAAVALSGVISVALGFIPVVGALFQVVISAYFIVYFILLFRSTQRIADGAPMIPAAPIAPAAS
ncbi:MAG: glycerophosphoryl diester phosphodiesterase membrane domain-containing protein, partial [bacterium]|nr:glycerophosphoryl diester phosphodiesterase membrane domain-containing protein [bacterium]